MSELERKIDRLVDKMDTIISGSGRIPTRTGAESQDGSVAAASKSLFESLGRGLKTTFDISGDLAGKALDQTATVSDATQAVATVLGKFGDIGGLTGDAFKGLTGILIGAVNNWQTFSGSGLQFGANAMAMNEAVKKTGLSFDQYRDLLDTAMPAFANFGQGLSAGAEIFGEASQVMLNTYGNQLGKLGMTTKDLNSVLALTARGMSSIDPSNNGINELAAQARNLAREMDKMAQVTGVSRKEQEKAIQTMQDDARIQATLAMKRRENPESAAAIDASIKAGAALDPAMQKLLTDAIAGGGIVSDDKIAQASAVHGPEIVNKMLEAARDTTSGDKEREKSAIEKISQLFGDISLNRGDRTKSGAQFVATGAVDNEFAKAAYQGADNRYRIYEANIAAYLEKYGTEARARLTADVENAQKGILNKDLIDPKTGKPIAKAGEEDPRAKTTEIVTSINDEIKRIGAGLTGLMTEINLTIAKQKDKTGAPAVQKIVDDARGFNPNAPSMSRIKELELKGREVIRQSFGDKPEGWEKATDPMAAFNKLMDEFKEKLLPKDGTSSPKTPAPTPVAPTSSSSINMPATGSLVNVNTKVSSATEAAPGSSNPVQVAGSSDVQDPVVAKLGEISTIMARVEQNTKNTARYSQDTASTMKEVGPFVA
jgi:hypothetical protein